jgi:hypothetical protein
MTYVSKAECQLSGPEEARLKALESLLDMAREMIFDVDYQAFSVDVVDAEGDVTYRASLVLKGEWAKKSVLT